jgi:23S rRNA pseudouridine1911/1915/1917 synthase
VVRRFRIERELRLDAFLAEARARLEGTPASAERALRHGGVHLNGRPLDAEALPPRVPAGSWAALYAFVREPEPVAFEPGRVLFDGDGVVAVDKPAWLPMQRTRASARLSLEAALRALLGDDSLVAAHRLDRQTSGVALFARGRSGAWAARALAARRAAKRYHAVTAPAPGEAKFAVEGFLARAPDPARFRFALRAEACGAARWSATRFEVLRAAGGRALVEARPETGRTHQIRVHLAAVAAPVAGDDLYGPAFAPGAASSAQRILLHAAELRLARPDGSTLTLSAETPPDLAAAL